MKTRKDKAYSFNHTKERALERYNINLTKEIYEEWALMCTWKTRLQIDESNMQEVHRIWWEGHPITVVVCQENPHFVKTVLPEGHKLMFGKDVGVKGFQW